MQDASITADLLEWLLLLLMVTTLTFAWRCHRAGVFSAFGRDAPEWRTLTRLGLACALPALLGVAWLWLKPELHSRALLGLVHLAISWYALRWLLPDDMTGGPPRGARHGLH